MSAWYDQSGGRYHARQSDAAKQPQLLLAAGSALLFASHVVHDCHGATCPPRPAAPCSTSCPVRRRATAGGARELESMAVRLYARSDCSALQRHATSDPSPSPLGIRPNFCTGINNWRMRSASVARSHSAVAHRTQRKIRQANARAAAAAARFARPLGASSPAFMSAFSGDSAKLYAKIADSESRPSAACPAPRGPAPAEPAHGPRRPPPPGRALAPDARRRARSAQPR